MKTDKKVIHYFESSDIFFFNSSSVCKLKKHEIVAELCYSLLH